MKFTAHQPLRLTVRFAFILGLILIGLYLWGAAVLIRLHDPLQVRERGWFPHYFPEPMTGWIQGGFYFGLLFWSIRGVLQRKWFSAQFAGAVFFVAGIFGTFGPWDFVRDGLAGVHLFVGIVLWRWGKQCRGTT
jgi:hypothetical protein